jgi:4-hydroxybenzoyl-CoA reductase subunit beta
METLPDFRLVRPASVADALKARAATPGSRWLAGGTDLLPNMRRGLVASAALIDLGGIAELKQITVDADGVRIGAGVTLTQLAANETVRRDFPALAEAALAIAGPTHRVSGTVGGNLCLDTRCRFYNQSEPWRAGNEYCKKIAGDTCRVAPNSDRCFAAYSGDLAPALLVLDAVAEVAGPGGTRRLPLADLYADDGIDYLALKPDELLVAVRVPAAPGLRSGYEKLRVRQSIEFALAGVAVALRLEGDVIRDLRIAVTGTDSRPIALVGLDGDWKATEEDDARIAKLLRKQTGPLETTNTAAAYRRRTLPVLARRLIARLAKGA